MESRGEQDLDRELHDLIEEACRQPGVSDAMEVYLATQPFQDQMREAERVRQPTRVVYLATSSCPEHQAMQQG